MRLGGGHEEVGIVHAERIEDPFFQKLFERLAADFSDEIADDVGGDGIIPGFAWRKLQRNFREIIDHRIQRSRFHNLADFRFAVGGVDIGALLEAVSEAGGVPQQVHDQHRPRWRLGQEGRRDPSLEHAQILPFRDVFMDRLVERDAALLDQHHEGHAGDRLGHRIDAKNRVVLDRRLALDIGKALHRAVDHLAAAVDQELGSRKAAGIDVFDLQMIVETVEGGLGHAGGFGRGWGRG